MILIPLLRYPPSSITLTLD